MKHVLLLIGLLLSLTTQAAPHPRRAARSRAIEHVRPAAPDSVQLRAAGYARYLTDALHLSTRQAQAVQRYATEQAAAAAPAQAWLRFDQQMLRILSPGQYNTFAWLAERLPR